MDGEDMLIVPKDMGGGGGSMELLYIDGHLKGESREESIFNHKKQNQRNFAIPIQLGNYNVEIGSVFSPLKDTKN